MIIVRIIEYGSREKIIHYGVGRKLHIKYTMFTLFNKN